MAGIIAQLNAANRRRKNRKFAEVPNEKSVYLLPPFSSGAFSPTRHNKWMVQVLSTSVQAQDTSCLVYTCTDSSKVKLSVFLVGCCCCCCCWLFGWLVIIWLLGWVHYIGSPSFNKCKIYPSIKDQGWPTNQINVLSEKNAVEHWSRAFKLFFCHQRESQRKRRSWEELLERQIVAKWQTWKVGHPCHHGDTMWPTLANHWWVTLNMWLTTDQQAEMPRAQVWNPIPSKWGTKAGQKMRCQLVMFHHLKPVSCHFKILP